MEKEAPRTRTYPIFRAVSGAQKAEFPPYFTVSSSSSTFSDYPHFLYCFKTILLSIIAETVRVVSKDKPRNNGRPFSAPPPIGMVTYVRPNHIDWRFLYLAALTIATIVVYTPTRKRSRDVYRFSAAPDAGLRGVYAEIKKMRTTGDYITPYTLY